MNEGGWGGGIYQLCSTITDPVTWSRGRDESTPPLRIKGHLLFMKSRAKARADECWCGMDEGGGRGLIQNMELIFLNYINCSVSI